MNAYAPEDEALPLLDTDTTTQKEDTPVAYSPPEFKFAGANMGAEPVMECSRCGAMLRESNCFLHTHFHELLDRPKVVQ